MNFTNQQLFDIAYTGLVKQGKGSFDVDKRICQYNGPDGTHCAIGLMLPHDVRERVREGAGVQTILTLYAAVRDFFGYRGMHAQSEEERDQRQLLSDLQAAHDGAAMTCYNDSSRHFPTVFRRNMTGVAVERKLTIPRV